MPADNTHVSTGLPGLDHVFQGLRPGDNIVFQVDSIADYLPFVRPFHEWALAQGRRLIYFRFAKHEPLLPDDGRVEIHHLQPEAGFEGFITAVHGVIERAGHEACYVFDALSELSLDPYSQYSDQMLGNLYKLTCPYLFSLRTVAYYALLKNYHSFHASSPIAETTQILVDVYRLDGKVYIHPRKVQYRYSQTMHMLHVWEDDEFHPVRESNVVSAVLTSTPRPDPYIVSERPGNWTRSFMEAEETFRAWQAGETSQAKADETFHQTLRTAITRDERALELCHKYLSLADVLDIKRRMVSSGLIGGKSVGMVVARAILRKAGTKWASLLEPHDSFFVGSDVFYSFLVQNNCWRARQKQKDPAAMLDSADDARQHLLAGRFREHIKDRLERVLDYFGLSPVIVRSSSLLEDSMGNAFAGKYESVFCANQGPRHIRLEDLLNAIRAVYASSMSREALTYRAERGLLDRDEQMAILIQRVSGTQYGGLYFPHVAGVGFSFNPYVWSKDIDPEAGLLRLVFGLGTRAVDRADDDYTRVVALNVPGMRPEADINDVRRYTQRRADVLDLVVNTLESRDFVDVVKTCPDLPLEQLASCDHQLARRRAERDHGDTCPWLLTFDGLLTRTNFASDMREMLRILQDAYGCPVDTEFTLNFMNDGNYRINLLQCRALQTKRYGTAVPLRMADIAREDMVMEVSGPVIGQSRELTLDRVVYIVPATYGQLLTAERYEVARIVGQLNALPRPQPRGHTMLLGPGRWGTSTPALGVPVSFRDIRSAAVVSEIVAMRDDLVPDVSLGTHFFSDFIEADILYVALFPSRPGNYLDARYLEASPNKLPALLPSAARWSHVIRVIDTAEALRPGRLALCADTVRQRVICYVRT